MIVETTETFEREYKALNAATKMRVRIAVGRLEAQDSALSYPVVDHELGVRAAVIDDFLCLTFERIEGGIRLRNVKSIDITR